MYSLDKKMMIPPINFKKWINDNRELLKPPVCNKVVYEDTEFIIMVVGGPNTRKDYHVDEGEEFFYQLEGKMTLRIIEDNKPTSCGLIKLYLDKTILPFLISSPFFLTFFFLIKDLILI